MIGNGATVIDIRSAAAVLGGAPIWHDVTVTIREGDFVAVLGPNGVGKSTLLKAMLGLQPLSAGHIEVLGTAPRQARRSMGYLPQRRNFDAGVRLRGTDLVRLGIDGDQWGLPLPGPRARQRARRVVEVVAMVDADRYARRPLGTLSGGEQQRLLIAQALAHEPRILLLDEPLDSLDLPNQAAIAALLHRISRDHHVTVVIVAHDVNPILGYLDQVVYLGQGRAMSGPPHEVITAEALSTLYGTQIEVMRSATGQLIVVGQPDVAARHPAPAAP